MFIVPYYCLFSWLSIKKAGKGLGIGGGSNAETLDTAERRLQWYRNNWAAIFRYVPVSVGVAVASNITDAVGVYCPFGTTSFHFAKVYLEIISNISVSVAVTAIFGLYANIKTPLAIHKPLHKLLCFKIVVFFGFVVSIVFLVLGFTKALDPTPTMSYGDMKSIQPMILCIAMVPISVYFHYAYSWQEYRLGATHRPIRDTSEGNQSEMEHYQGGLLGWRAFVQALSWMEVLRGIVFTFKMFSEFQHERDEDTTYYETTAATELLTQGTTRYEPYSSRNLEV
ncbi:hypothetical protein PRZ48_003367 [Zasmidium cellare]|uniref:Uncharacterized protein n=1 Tax=Zasmidium cellare TaxID=395010 RepID=A0ABR0EUV6_ZASCE|nr:hypothetical protein PRZ48_003367 [Zasmidium cellare]